MPNLNPFAFVTDNEAGSDGYLVQVVYPNAGVDRPCTHGYRERTRPLAERLAQAINAGEVEIDQEICTDVNGRTYVFARFVAWPPSDPDIETEGPK